MALAALGLAVAMVAATGWLFGVTLESKPAIVTLGAILVMGLAHLMLTAAAAGSAPATLARTAAGAAAVAVTYFTLQWGAETLLVPTLPAAALPGPATALLMGVFLAVFTLTALIQILAPSRRHRPGWRRAYVALRNGLYTNAMNNRIVGVPAPKTPA
jgi:NAD(P)H-quinone oxidoreductase subunit 5